MTSACVEKKRKEKKKKEEEAGPCGHIALYVVLAGLCIR